ncbi:MAG: ABC transporter ATP-binding protein [Lachnospiraceae bacterium]|nr:ABC transporter ATP-binding protein [Lachnospiraceae bacterium]
MGEEPVISFKHFGFQYRAQAEPTLHDISFDIRKGEKILIAGPSGCGKSTIASAINGLIPFAYKGTITGSLKVLGKETRDMGIFELSHIVGTVLQDTDAQFIGMTVAEDIAFAMENDCRKTDEMHQRVSEIAKTLELDAHLKHAPGEMSGGQKQRVSVGGVMVDDVDVFLFDEPLANLDPATGRQAMELIDGIQRLTGAAVIIIEHRLEDVLHIPIDRVILMQEGRIVSDSSPDELLVSARLAEAGIREPLYLTAMKYAGVRPTEEQQPARIQTLALDVCDKALIRAWYHEAPEEEKRRTAEPFLQIRDLEFTYENGFRATKNISADIGKGEMLAVVGKNGAGKTTFAKLICGFERPQAGRMLLDGKDLLSMSIKERAEHIGYVMQDPNQMICKTMIFDEVALGLVNRGKDSEFIQEKVYQVLKVCGLYPFRNWPVSALSYGQKKRVTIASILALDPEMIILDEPTAGQDFRHYTEIMEFLRELNRSGLTVVMITHDMHLMLEYSERTVVFCDGSIIKDATGAEILTDPVTVEKAALKETSLYYLADQCGISDARSFVQRFIDHDRRVRA